MFKWLKEKIFGEDKITEVSEETSETKEEIVEEKEIEMSEEISETKEEIEEEKEIEMSEEIPETKEEIEEEKEIEMSEEIPETKEEIEEEKEIEVSEETSETKEEIEEEKEIEVSEETSETKEEIEEEKEIEVSEEIPETKEEIEEEKEIEVSEEIPETKEEIEEEKEIEVSEEIPETKEEIVEEKEIEVSEETSETKEVKLSFFEKLKKGLTKTRDNFTDQISNIIKSYQKVDEELLEELEEVLITADVGVETTMNLIDNLRDKIKEDKVTDPSLVMELLKNEIKELMYKDDLDTSMNIEQSPAVILVVGVNGVGKTTTIGKMASRYKNEGKKVLIAAGDTFRAAAIEQLGEWGKRANVDIISHSEGSDPAAVIFDGVQAAKSRNMDLLICDTAGRLHNKANLMNELNKIARVLEKEYPEAKKEVLLVLDATTGQNAMSQAKVFKEAANITGIALTKLDGTAKGGVVIALQAELGVPIKFIGVGEGIDDLQPFDAKDFIDAIFETEE